jgi:hypothetical protein
MISPAPMTPALGATAASFSFTRSGRQEKLSLTG